MPSRHGAGIFPEIKSLLLVLAVVLVGCASGPITNSSPSTDSGQPLKPKVISNSPAVVAAVEAAIRKAAGKPTGELSKADFEKVTSLDLASKQLTDLPKGLEKLTQLEDLYLNENPALTKAQIAELKKALPNCNIYSTPKK